MNRAAAGVTAVCAVYLALSIGEARTKRPWCDEAWYASPGLNLATRGDMGTSVLDPASTTWKGVRLDGIDRHTYWAMPLDFLAEAAWFKLFGFGLFQLRLLSTLWGLAALLSWYFIVRTLVDDPGVALLAILLLGTEYYFLDRTSDGRMDAMSAAFAAAALAAYLGLRRRNLAAAMLSGHVLAAAAFFTHPNGGIMAFLALVFFALYFDRRALRPVHAAMAVLPYLAGGVAWGIYVLQDPAAFRAQFFSTAVANRWGGLLHPWTALQQEIAIRYMKQYGFGWWAHGAARLAILAPLSYAAALAAGFAVPEFRRHPGTRGLFVFTALYFVYMWLFEGFKTWLYLIHILPWFAAALAVCLAWMWRTRVLPAPAVAALAAVLIGVQAARTVRLIRSDPYRNSYAPAVAFLESNAAGGVVMGSAELGFRLGFRPTLVDDIRLGYGTGRRAEFIVVDDSRYADNLAAAADSERDVWRYTSRLLSEEYTPVYRHEGYVIYRRKADRRSQKAGSGNPDS